MPKDDAGTVNKNAGPARRPDKKRLFVDIETVLAKLEETDNLLPRSIEDWVLERKRDGLHVPEILERRLAEKEELRAHVRRVQGPPQEDND